MVVFASATNFESTTTTFNLSTIPSTTTNRPTIKEFIADDRALYFGGGGGSSSSTTFNSLTDTPTGYQSGYYFTKRRIWC